MSSVPCFNLVRVVFLLFCQQLFAGLRFLQCMTFTLDGFSDVGFCWLVWVRVGGGRVW